MKTTKICCKAIVCCNKNFAIGKNGQLLYHIPEDITFFKNITYNKYVVVGRKTYESIPNGLPNRKIIVLTHKEYKTNKDIQVATSVQNVFNIISKTNENDFFVIGGEQIYNQFSSYFDKIYMTYVDDFKNGDAFFCKINFEKYKYKLLSKNIYNKLKYSLIEYVKNN